MKDKVKYMVGYGFAGPTYFVIAEGINVFDTGITIQTDADAKKVIGEFLQDFRKQHPDWIINDPIKFEWDGTL